MKATALVKYTDYVSEITGNLIFFKIEFRTSFLAVQFAFKLVLLIL